MSLSYKSSAGSFFATQCQWRRHVILSCCWLELRPGHSCRSRRRIFCRDAVSVVPPCPSVVAGLSCGQVILVEVKRRFFVSLRSVSGVAMPLAAVAGPCCGQVILVEVKRMFFCRYSHLCSSVILNWSSGPSIFAPFVCILVQH